MNIYHAVLCFVFLRSRFNLKFVSRNTAGLITEFDVVPQTVVRITISIGYLSINTEVKKIISLGTQQIIFESQNNKLDC